MMSATAVIDGAGREKGGDSAPGLVGETLEAALRARAPGVHASTPLVRQLALKVGRELGLDADAQTLLDLAVRVRDIGIVALPDEVVLATTPLTASGWERMCRHPVIGAQLIEGLSTVTPAAPVVRAHHERWDGTGYPDGRSGDSIPLLSRVIAACDAFVAMASDRPHRLGIGAEAALEQLCQERGSQFDPRMVDALTAALTAAKTASPRAHTSPADRPLARRAPSHPKPQEGQRRDLTSVIAEFELVPAFAPALERVLAATATTTSSQGELVEAVESDIGLTVAVLRRAQTIGARRPIANVADAIAALSPAEIEQAVTALPRAEFPWRTSPLEVVMHHMRVHAQAVTRAADRIARVVKLFEPDDLLAAGLLHDIGKLVIARAIPDYTAEIEKQVVPEARIRKERRSLGLDHASLGGLLLRRWGLPDRLASAVVTHHSSEAENDIATYVRLADMVAHHAQGDAVDRRVMLRLADLCGLSPHALRDVLFDLPRSGGSQRRRAEPSPLSDRETAVLADLAQGMVYKEIALDLGLAVSTVRTHLHNTYQKLGVDDRAQAVLRATEMGWV